MTFRDRIKSYLNTAQERIARHVEIRELYTTQTYPTVVGTSAYTMPSDFIRATGLLNVSQQQPMLFLEDPNELRQVNLIYQSSSPAWFSFSEAGLLVAPTPNIVESLLLTYYKRPTDMSSDTDVSILPVDYHDLMVSWALARCYRAEDDVQMSQFYVAEYQRDLALLRADRQYEDTEPRQVPNMWDKG